MQEITNPYFFVTKPTSFLCNMNCTYCYYLKKKELYPQNQLTMSDYILEKYISEYIDSQPKSFNKIYFIWQGGEPTLLGLGFFEKIIKLQKKYKPFNVEILNSLQTNGTILDENFAKFFKENNFLIGISIDGPEKLHNYYRKYKNGSGSFKKVMKGINLLQKYNVDFNILTAVQNNNSKHPKKIYDFLKSIGTKFIQFIPIVDPEKDKTVTEYSVKPKQWGIFMTEIFYSWLSDIGEIFIQQFDDTLGSYLGIPANTCSHSKECGKGLVIEHNGDIYSCDHFVSPKYYLGNIAEKKLSTLAESQTQISFGKNKFSSLPEECIQCKYLAICYGGCPKERFIKKETGNLSWLCEGYLYFHENTEKYFSAMKQALHNNRTADEYYKYL